MNKLPNAENELWNRFKEGDRKAFEQIYNTHFSSLCNYAFRFCGSLPQAKDGVQQLFIKLWDHKEKISTPVSVRHYLIKSLRNILLDRFKTDKRTKPIDAGDTYFYENPHEFLLIQENIWEEQHQYLRKALDTLTKRQREAVYLKFFENLSYDEVSNTMSLTVDSVYNLISKAIEVLRKNTPYVNLMLLISLLS